MDAISAQVEKLAPKPGEVVVVTLPEMVTAEEAARVTEQLRDILPDGVKVAVVTPGVRLSVACSCVAAALEARAAETLALTAVADDREEAAELRARAAGLREAAGLVRARGAAP